MPSAAALAFKPGAWQSAFTLRRFDQGIADIENFLRDPFKERGPVALAGRAIDIECAIGRGTGGGDIVKAMHSQRRAMGRAGVGINRTKFGHRSSRKTVFDMTRVYRGIASGRTCAGREPHNA